MILRNKLVACVAAGIVGVSGASDVLAKERIEAGVLECSGEGGWGLIIGSQKTMRCTFTSAGGKRTGFYDATITKFGLDIGKTG